MPQKAIEKRRKLVHSAISTVICVIRNMVKAKRRGVQPLFTTAIAMQTGDITIWCWHCAWGSCGGGTHTHTRNASAGKHLLSPPVWLFSHHLWCISLTNHVYTSSSSIIIWFTKRGVASCFTVRPVKHIMPPIHNIEKQREKEFRVRTHQHHHHQCLQVCHWKLNWYTVHRVQVDAVLRVAQVEKNIHNDEYI